MKINFLEKSLIIFGLFWGILGFGIYFLGILGFFNKTAIISYSFLLVLILIIYSIKKKYFSEKLDFLKKAYSIIRSDWILLVLSIFVLAFFVLNFILTLAPEIEFDALWYHLTLPKIYLQTGSVEYLKGGLFYYSAMPRLVEMIYGFGLAINSYGLLVKLIHFSFGIAWFFGIFIFARQYLNRRNAMFSAVTIYSLYLVTWLSATAYIDLAVGFFVIMSLWALVKYFNNHEISLLYLSAIFMGLNLSSKTYGLMILAVVLVILLFKSGLKKAFLYGLISIVIVFPFYLQAYFATGNPIYPVFSVPDLGLFSHLDGKNTLGSWYKEAWAIKLPSLFWEVVVNRYTPLFGLIFAIFFVANWKKIFIPITLFIGFFVFWSLVPMHEPRYFMVILPVLSLIIFYIFENTKSFILKTAIITLLIVGVILNLSKTFQYFPETFNVVFSKTSQTEYLEKKLFLPQTFYDFSGNIIKEADNKKVLTVGIHNLFYLPFDFIDWTFIEDKFDGSNPKSLIIILKENQIDYILGGDMSMTELNCFEKDFLNDHFDLILEENHFRLYKINY